MIIGIPVYHDVDLFDVTGAHEVFKWIRDPAIEVRLIAASVEQPIVTRDGFRFLATHNFQQVAALDVLWVPGGDLQALAGMMSGTAGHDYMSFLATIGARAKWVCSVCEGALLSAAAGLLDGYEATTHWKFIPCLRQFEKVTVVDGFPRYHLDRNRLTGGGISSAIDESLHLVRLLKGDEVARGIQRTMQYFPEPPFPADLVVPPTCMFSWTRPAA
ncbi:DJ-1/PfpI family protein [Mesorhizobium sp. M0220]|uniref:DJ-1/PfpI family protein n=1 Tax=unclassified Mesorhizobium TaxID=325217 RepID=UPI00333CB90F